MRTRYNQKILESLGIVERKKNGEIEVHCHLFWPVFGLPGQKPKPPTRGEEPRVRAHACPYNLRVSTYGRYDGIKNERARRSFLTLLRNGAQEEEGKERRKKEFKISSYQKELKCVQVWNAISYTPTHHITSPPTKTLIKILCLLRDLRKGKMASNYNWDKKWLQRHKITSRMLEHKWKVEEIIKNLDQLSKMYLQGYWPEDKRWIPRNLGTLIYNPRRHNGWFFSVQSRGAQIVSQRIERFSPSQKEVYNRLTETFSQYMYDPQVKREVLSTVEKVYKYYERLPFDKYGKIEQEFPNEYTFALEYCKWIKDSMETRRFRIDPEYLLPGTWTWKRFLKDTSRKIGISLITGKEP